MKPNPEIRRLIKKLKAAKCRTTDEALWIAEPILKKMAVISPGAKWSHFKSYKRAYNAQTPTSKNPPKSLQESRGGEI